MSKLINRVLKQWTKTSEAERERLVLKAVRREVEPRFKRAGGRIDYVAPDGKRYKYWLPPSAPFQATWDLVIISLLDAKHTRTFFDGFSVGMLMSARGSKLLQEMRGRAQNLNKKEVLLSKADVETLIAKMLKDGKARNRTDAVENNIPRETGVDKRTLWRRLKAK